jgi:hypothetical protein
MDNTSSVFLILIWFGNHVSVVHGSFGDGNDSSGGIYMEDRPELSRIYRKGSLVIEEPEP